MTPDRSREGLFTSLDSNAATFGQRLSEAWPGVRFSTCLDIGCGTGALLLALRQSGLIARGLGIDVSRPTVEAARARFEGIGGLECRCVDVLDRTSNLGQFQLVTSDSVLHMIDASDRELAARLASLCESNGYLCISLPHDGIGNAIRVMVRRALHLVRCDGLERAMLWLGRRVYRRLPEHILRERLPYTFFIPPRLFGPSVRQALEQAGFELTCVMDLPNPSILKLSHRICFFRFRAGTGLPGAGSEGGSA